MRKICVVITARASFSRIRTALLALSDHPEAHLDIVLAGSSLLDRYGDIRTQLKQDKLKIAAEAYHVVDGADLLSSAKTVGLGIIELSNIFVQLRPDIVVTVADRFETMATAVTSSFMNIPLAHIQGGEISGNIDEKVRHSITKLADLHLVSTEIAKERVIRMGEDPKTVHVTGCPSIDLAAEIMKMPDLNFDPIEKYGGVGSEISWHDGYLVAMQHPVTTQFKDSKKQILETLHAISDSGIPTFWFWPNLDAGADDTSKGIRSYRENNRPENIRFFKNMDSLDFLRLLKNSLGIIGNSSVGIRECSFLGVPAVNIGNRQVGRDRADNVIDVDETRLDISQAINRILSKPNLSGSNLYGQGFSGEIISTKLLEFEMSFVKTLQY